MLKVRTALCFSLLSAFGSPAVLASVPANFSANPAANPAVNSLNAAAITAGNSSLNSASFSGNYSLNPAAITAGNSSANTASVPAVNSSANTASVVERSTESVRSLTPSRDIVSVERALGNSGSPYRVFLSPGTGVSISVPDGEFIEKVWLDNPAEIVVDANGCLSGLPKLGECKGEATALHLRSIERLNFPGVLVSPSSLLSIIAAAPDGKRNIYLFEIIPSAGGKQTIFSIAIENPQPVVPVAPQVASMRPRAISAQAVERGAAIAASASIYPPNSPVWNRVRDFVSRLKGGQGVGAAAAAAGVSLELLYKLQTLGVLSGSNI